MCQLPNTVVLLTLVQGVLPTLQVLTLGDWCVPGHELRAVARPSDFMLTHLALFGAEDEDNVATWAACFDATLEVTFNKW
jgi:hypothetical protein